MSKRHKETKFMSIGDISKRVSRSQVCEKSSTSAQNPPKVTITEPTSLDGYNDVQKIGTIPPNFDNRANTKTKIQEDKRTEVTEKKMADSASQAQTPIFEKSRLLNTNRTMESESAQKHVRQTNQTMLSNQTTYSNTRR